MEVEVGMKDQNSELCAGVQQEEEGDEVQCDAV